ncbi:MFS transporter [Paenarthrobacter ureafaciens]|uniref:MFS transporter n=1 Tax=Paenarthrobacter ureafaciens TaxID=37931 RepID=UPI001FB20309|nr:MFS transporter [Paenarthrobacter ureafaciens]UOD82073.1 MFS transporter [Paenarthrobacter ureafaciens]WNZ05567.1 MFS transporter [Paenarthrobacter ureafaciens]
MGEKRRAVPGHGPRPKTVMVLLALVLVSINLRPAITTIAGVMNQLEDAFQLGPQWLPLLGTLPVLAFGVSGPIGPWLARRLGAGRAVAVTLLVLAAALIVRATIPALLLPGTFLCGMAIMTASVLVPQIVKTNRGTGWWTGLCTMGFGLGAALGAGLVRPLEHAFGGSLSWALAVWAVPALVGAFLIQRSGGGPSSAVAPNAVVPTAVVPLRKQRTAWAVTAFFGLQAMLYFAITSWLAVFLVSEGLSSADAAALLAWFSLAGLPASLLAPVLAGKPKVLRILGPGLGLSVAVALIGVLVAPSGAQFLMVGVLGVVQSAGFGLAMALVVIRSAGPLTAGRLSAMSQGFGFALASLGPLAAGLLHTWTGGWEAPFLAMAGEALVLAAAGYLAIRGPLVSIETHKATAKDNPGQSSTPELVP